MRQSFEVYWHAIQLVTEANLAGDWEPQRYANDHFFKREPKKFIFSHIIFQKSYNKPPVMLKSFATLFRMHLFSRMYNDFID